MDVLSEKKLEKYIKDHNFFIKNDTLQYILKKFNKKNSKLFKNINLKKGGGFLPGEFFGVNTGAYSETLSNSPTEMSTSNVLNTSTRPALESNIFPLEGGCGVVGRGECKTCIQQSAGCAGCTRLGGAHSGGGKCHKHNKLGCTCKHAGGCIVCKNFFTNKNIKDLSNVFNLKLNKINSNEMNIYLSNNLKKIMHLTFGQVKNKDRLIGKSHFTKGLKFF